VERNSRGIINYKKQAFPLYETRKANKSDLLLEPACANTLYQGSGYFRSLPGLNDVPHSSSNP